MTTAQEILIGGGILVIFMIGYTIIETIWRAAGMARALLPPHNGSELHSRNNVETPEHE